jgi:hypothetical protein
MMPDWWATPEGVRVRPDGAWHVGAFAIQHSSSLRFLKARLVFEKEGAFLVEGQQRVPVEVRGPAFEVTALRLDAAAGEARVTLDDGSEEPVSSNALSLADETGRFECLVRGGQARAVLSRGAHQALLEHVEETAGGFVLRVGARRIPVRT